MIGLGPCDTPGIYESEQIFPLNGCDVAVLIGTANSVQSRTHFEALVLKSIPPRSVTMSSESAFRGTGCSKQFLPELKPLESRLLLSRLVNFPDGTSVTIPALGHLPRTGGVSEQSGAVLGIGVGHAKGNSVNVSDSGKGGILAEWNGGPVHSFTSVKATVIEIERARFNQVTFNLAGPVTHPMAAEVGTRASTETPLPSEGDHPQLLRVARAPRTSGTAFQSGSVLTVTVYRSTTNNVEISNGGGGNVAVQWNGGPVHSFAGISTIVVDTENGRNDLVALDDVSH